MGVGRQRKKKDVSMKVKGIEKMDQAPRNCEEKMPRKLLDALAAQKRVEERNQRAVEQSQAKPASRGVMPDTSILVPKMPGESDWAFNRRLGLDTRDLLRQINASEPKKPTRPSRKAYLQRQAEKKKDKKQKKRLKVAATSVDDEERQLHHQSMFDALEEKYQKNRAGDHPVADGRQGLTLIRTRKRTVTDFSELQDPVAFGEVAERPPTLNFQRINKPGRQRLIAVKPVPGQQTHDEQAGMRAERAYKLLKAKRNHAQRDDHDDE